MRTIDSVTKCRTESTPLPVTLLTGFLGSGKTTLLNRLLKARPLTAVVMNEFGKITLDHLLLGEMRGPMALLSGGCVCIVIETTGIADPAPILDTLLHDRHLAARLAMDGVVTTVDAVLGFYLLFALGITASVQVVGVYLVFASLIVPALVAGGGRLWLGYGLGATGYALGLLASALFNLPSGAAIVLALTGVAIIAAGGRGTQPHNSSGLRVSSSRSRTLRADAPQRSCSEVCFSANSSAAAPNRNSTAPGRSVGLGSHMIIKTSTGIYCGF